MLEIIPTRRYVGNKSNTASNKAQQAGLLTSDAIERMLREAVRSRRIARLAEARRNIAAAGVAPLTMEEIQAEIEADRAERRGKATG